MNKKRLAGSALAVLLIAIAAFAMGNVAISADLVAPEDLDAADDTEMADDNLTGAGGGGWLKNEGAKNTFGFYLNATDTTMSELVLQARDVGVTVHAYQFDSVVFNYDAGLGTGSAEATGMASVAGVNATFHLVVEDNGDRSLDRFMLELSGDYAGLWDVTGLGGGQIWVFLE